jgi:hypothetical protein
MEEGGFAMQYDIDSSKVALAPDDRKLLCKNGVVKWLGSISPTGLCGVKSFVCRALINVKLF